MTGFDKTANAAKKKLMDMSQTALRLKLIHDATLSDSQRHLVLVEINLKKKQEVYEKAKLGLNKYLAGMDGKDGSGDEKGIKLENEFYTEEEEAMLTARGFYRGGSSERGGRGGGSSGSSGRGGLGRGASNWSTGNAIYGGKDHVNPKSEWRATPVPVMWFISSYDERLSAQLGVSEDEDR